ncbi:MAG: PD-(D/E)XK nuclease family transposase, partial [Lachnospiraceae bacterium]|nr:PD-(D/E)XK nuclease family transposase [Lachnospiraceae bacterium]
FYATYQLLNVKNYTKYSDKLCLSVLDLTQRKLATEEDRLYQIDDWATLFKATTWEDLKMLAENNSVIAEASATVYKLSQDEKVRLQCEAREDYYRHQASIQYEMDRRDAILKEQNAKIEERNATIEEQDARIEERNAKIEALTIETEDLTAKLESAITEKQTLLAEKKQWALEREQLLAQIHAEAKR